MTGPEKWHRRGQSEIGLHNAMPWMPESASSSSQSGQHLRSSSYQEASSYPSSRDAAAAASSSPSSSARPPPPPLATLLPPPSALPSFSPTFDSQQPLQAGSPRSMTRMHPPDLLLVKPKAPITRVDQHFSTQLVAGQRRTFRQRRKDPSCDSCRERKVKVSSLDGLSMYCRDTDWYLCDDTVRCNRKSELLGMLAAWCKVSVHERDEPKIDFHEVSDLEKQLASLKRDNQRLRALHDSKPEDMDIDEKQPVHKMQRKASSSTSHSSFRRSWKFQSIHHHMTTFSSGIFETSFVVATVNQKQPVSDLRIDSRRLPHFDISSHIVRYCSGCGHPCFSAVPWSRFEDLLAESKHTGYFEVNGHAEAAILFSAIAIGFILDPSMAQPANGSLSRPQDTYIEEAAKLSIHAASEPSKDACIAMLLISAYMMEDGARSAAWTWFGFAVSMASNSGIFAHAVIHSSEEFALERRIWRAFILWERADGYRLLTMDLSKSSIIDADEYDDVIPQVLHFLQIDYTSAPNEAYRPEMNKWLKLLGQMLEHKITARIPLSLRQVEHDLLSRADGAVDSLCKTLDGIEPQELVASTVPYSMRILLHRPFLSTSSSKEQRTRALRSCYSAARDTARMLEASMSSSQPGTSQAGTSQAGTSQLSESRPASDWVRGLCGSFASLVCTHMWRCIVVLGAHLDFEALKACIAVAVAVGDSRRINVACSWSVFYFLEQLSGRVAAGEMDRQAWLEDEEILAYISTDLQGDPRYAWAWDREEAVSSQTSPRKSSVFSPYSYSPQTQISSQSQSQPEPQSRFPAGRGHAWLRVESLLADLREQITRQRPLPPMPEPFSFARPGKAAPEPLRDTDTLSQSHTHSHFQSQPHTHSHLQSQSHTDSHPQSQSHTDSHPQSQSHAQTQTQTQAHAGSEVPSSSGSGSGRGSGRPGTSTTTTSTGTTSSSTRTFSPPSGSASGTAVMNIKNII